MFELTNQSGDLCWCWLICLCELNKNHISNYFDWKENCFREIYFSYMLLGLKKTSFKETKQFWLMAKKWHRVSRDLIIMTFLLFLLVLAYLINHHKRKWALSYLPPRSITTAFFSPAGSVGDCIGMKRMN